MANIQDFVDKTLAVTWDEPPCSDVDIPNVGEEWARFEEKCFNLTKRTMTRAARSEEEIADAYAKCLTFHDPKSAFTVKAARESLHAWRLQHYMGLAKEDGLTPKDLIARMGPQFDWKELIVAPSTQGLEEAYHTNYCRAVKRSHLIMDGFGRALGREFFASDCGHIGWAPPGARLGDQIYVFHGCKIPYVLRRASRPGHFYQLIGACYLQGFMDGEGLELQGETTAIKLI